MKALIRGCLPLLAIYATPLLAADAPRIERPPTAKAGQSMDYVDRLMSVPCQHWQVKEANRNGVMISQCGDNYMHLSLDNHLNPVKVVKASGETLVEFKPFFPQLSYPLSLGKKWSGEYDGYTADDGAKWSSKVSCEVKAWEKVKVVAGEFDSYRIECQEKWRALLILTGESKSTRWYAPAVGMVVKAVSDKNKWDHQLAGYKFD